LKYIPEFENYNKPRFSKNPKIIENKIIKIGKITDT